MRTLSLKIRWLSLTSVFFWITLARGPVYPKCHSKVPRWHFGGKGINLLLDNPHATQKTPGAAIGKSNRTAKRLTKALQEKGLLVRKNGKRNGILEVQT